MKKAILTVACFGILSTVGTLADWSQWRGPHRDGISKETGLLKSWPEGGPAVLWSVEGLGEGYSSPSVTDDSVYVSGMVGTMGTLFAYDLQGKLRWKRSYGPEFDDSYPGARSTPTVDGDRVYVFSAHGVLGCFAAADGKKIWSVDVKAKYNGVLPKWGFAESVLVDGGKVFCTPGGPNASVVALDKMTGQDIWRTKGLSESSGYCSPILAHHNGRDILITLTAKSIVGIVPDTGKVLWKHGHITSYDVNAITPVYVDGTVYVTSGYGSGGVLLRLSDDGTKVTEVWQDKTLDTHHGGVVVVDGYAYGSAMRRNWICLGMKDGKVRYEAKGVGKGSVTYADGMLYTYAEKGTVGLVKATPSGHDVVSSFKVSKGAGPHWSHPVISEGRLYLRHGDAMVVYDIKAKQKAVEKAKVAP